MNLIKELDESTSCIVLCDESGQEKQIPGLEKFKNLLNVTLTSLLSIDNDSADVIVSNLQGSEFTKTILEKLAKILKPGGKLFFSGQSQFEKIKLDLIMSGFMNVHLNEDGITAVRPKYEVGSAASLNLPTKIHTVWKLDDTLDDVETIDPDDLLDEDDLKKPDPSSLRVCGTTGKRKACKDCSCGLAEELATEAKTGKVIDTKDAPKSSCGSCYLGDAFRCATCPYLGMPAFKPGEKIQLAGNQLQADL